jgi:hypothetical protein
MPSKPLNRSLRAAKATMQDEFYTQLSDIEKELRRKPQTLAVAPPERVGRTICEEGSKPCESIVFGLLASRSFAMEAQSRALKSRWQIVDGGQFA